MRFLKKPGTVATCQIYEDYSRHNHFSPFSRWNEHHNRDRNFNVTVN